MGHGIAQVHAAIGKQVDALRTGRWRAPRRAASGSPAISSGRSTRVGWTLTTATPRSPGSSRPTTLGCRRRRPRHRGRVRGSRRQVRALARARRARARPARSSPRTRARSPSAGWPRRCRASAGRASSGCISSARCRSCRSSSSSAHRTRRTRPSSAIRELSGELGKQVIVSADRPGFIVNRILMPFLAESMRALEQGVGTAEDIDAGARIGLNHPMGPLELADFIGLDVCLGIMRVLEDGLGLEHFRPPKRAGRTGRRRPPRAEDRARLLHVSARDLVTATVVPAPQRRGAPAPVDGSRLRRA